MKNYKNRDLFIKSTISSVNILKTFLMKKDLTLHNSFFIFDKKFLDGYFKVSLEMEPKIKELYDFNKDIFYYFLSKSLINGIIAIYISSLKNGTKNFNSFIKTIIEITNKRINAVLIRDFYNLLNDNNIIIHDNDMVNEILNFLQENKSKDTLKFEGKLTITQNIYNNKNFINIVESMTTIGIIFSIYINQHTILEKEFILFNS